MVKRKTITRDTVLRIGKAPGEEVKPQAQTQIITRQTVVWLTDDNLDWLDALRQQTRRESGKAFTRSAIIRALIQAAKETLELEFENLRTENDLIDQFRSKI